MRTCFFLFCPLLLSAQPVERSWMLPFGSQRGETIHDLFEAANGYVVLAGAVPAAEGKGANGYLLVLDPVSGNRVAERTIGHGGDDQFRSVAPTWDGGYLLAGFTSSFGAGGREGWLVKTDEAGTVEWEYYFGTGGADAFFCVETADDGSAWVAGQKNGRKDGDIWLLNIWKDRILWDTLIGNGQYSDVCAMIRTYPSGLALAGRALRGNKVWTLRVAGPGQPPLPAVVYDGGRAYVDASDLIETLDGGLAIAGIKRAQGLGDLDMWLWVQAPDGSTHLDQHYGGPRDDLAHALFQDAAGHFFLSGATKSDRVNALKFSAQVTQISPEGNFISTFPLPDDASRPPGSARAIGLHDEGLAVASVPDEPLKPGSALWVLKSAFARQSPSVALSKDDVEIELLVSNAVFEDKAGGNGNGLLEPGERGNIAFSLRNNSAYHLPDVRIELRDAATVKSAGYTAWPTVYTNTLKARQSRKIGIPVVGNKDLSNSKTTLHGSLFIKGRRVTGFDVVLECKAQGIFDAKDLARVRWIEPGARFADTIALSLDDKSLYIETDVIHGGKTPPRPRLVINDTHRPNSKAEQGQLKQRPAPPYGYDYTYSDKIPLDTDLWQEGINSVLLEFITDSGDTLRSDPLYLRLSRRKANLHVLAIGVPYENLRFTGADARAFAAAFNTQKGDSALWNTVYITQLAEAAQTTKQYMLDAFGHLKEQAESGHIAPRDLVLVFISSHGKIIGDKFKVLPSDYDGRESRTVDYKNDILEYLDGIPCKKILFIDACQSGAAPEGSKSDDTELSAYLSVLHGQLRGIATLSSCLPKELSYEDAGWGHGAFTAALLEALTNSTVTDPGSGTAYRANTDGDRALTLRELYAFLQRRVPAIVHHKNGKEQHPHLQVEGFKTEIPVFLYKQ